MSEEESLNTGGNGYFNVNAVEKSQTEDPAHESDEDVAVDDQQETAGEESLEASEEATPNVDEAELTRRRLQSERDSLQHNLGTQLTAITRRLQQLEQQPAQPVGSELGIQPDDLVDFQTVQKMVEGQKHSQGQVQDLIDDDTVNDWVNSQPHVQQVGDYVRANHLDQDASIMNTPMNLAGKYSMAEARMLRDHNAQLAIENEKLKKEFKRVKKQGSRGRVPPTGSSSGGRNTGSRSSINSALGEYFR